LKRFSSRDDIYPRHSINAFRRHFRFCHREAGLSGVPNTASGSTASAPQVILALIFQRYMVRGLTFGALKA
jgi:ABC-type glycerol-3-phosphate transport system permease component